MPYKDKDKQREYNRKYWEKNKIELQEYHKQYNRLWYEQNKKSRSLQIKEYDKSNPEIRRGIRKRFYGKHKAELKTMFKFYNRTIAGKYRTYKNSAKKRKLDFSLTKEDLSHLFSQPCWYCGNDGGGIDRINNSIGYTPENCQSCCKTCNYMKRTMTESEFISHIEQIYKNQHDL